MKMDRFIRQIKIQNRLVVSFAVLSLVPLLTTGLFSYYKSSEAMKTKISTYSIQVMNQVSENIQNELVRIENDSIDIAFLDIVQNTLLSFHTLNEWEKNDIELKMHDVLVKRFTFYRSISDVLLYTRNKEKIIAFGDFNFKLKLQPDYLNRILEETLFNNGIPIWTIEDRNNEEVNWNSDYRINNYGKYGILLSRSIKSLRQGIPLGYIMIRVNEKYILKKYQDIDIGDGADVFILDGKGTVISSRSPEMQVAMTYLDRSLIEKIKQNKEKDIYSFNSTISGKRNLIAYNYIPSADWYVVSAIPFSYLNEESIRIGIYITILGIICFLLALLLSLIVSKSISMPLKQLVNSMNNVKTGEFLVQIEDNSSDELGVVTTKFNTMVRELQFLIDEVKRKENLKRLAELKTLQAQINPHFLSNTLNTIRWLANKQKADNIASIITSLIELLHASMGKGSELISLREEIEYVKSYLNIMTYRYYDKFKVHFEMEEGVLDCQILKFILQPIVENSLLHGLEPAEGQGLIIIKGYRVENELKISITDNGVGVASEVMNHLLRGNLPIKERSLSGIGIRNVDERIKLYFGEQYGISIQSASNLFTTVEITIPAAGEKEVDQYAEGTYSG